MELDVFYQSKKVGRLKDIRNRIGFEYDPEFIERGIELSPLKLKLQRGPLFHDRGAFSNLFG